jgi:hypothetical protein
MAGQVIYDLATVVCQLFKWSAVRKLVVLYQEARDTAEHYSV